MTRNNQISSIWRQWRRRVLVSLGWPAPANRRRPACLARRRERGARLFLLGGNLQ